MEIDKNGDEITKTLPVPQSLRISAKEVSDYYTKAEYTAFMKPKSGKEKKMRRKKKEEIEPLEELEDGAGAEGGSTVLIKITLLFSSFNFFSFIEFC